MNKLKYRIEHIDNTTTGTCEICERFDILTLEKCKDENMYICSVCLDSIEKEIFGTVAPKNYYKVWKVVR